MLWYFAPLGLPDGNTVVRQTGMSGLRYLPYSQFRTSCSVIFFNFFIACVDGFFGDEFEGAVYFSVKIFLWFVVEVAVAEEVFDESIF